MTTSRTDTEGGVATIQFSSRASPDWMTLSSLTPLHSGSSSLYFPNVEGTTTINLPTDVTWSKSSSHARSAGSGAAFTFTGGVVGVSAGGSDYLVGDELVFASATQEFQLSVTSVAGGGSIVSSSPAGVSLKYRNWVPWTLNPLRLATSTTQVHEAGTSPNGRMYTLNSGEYTAKIELVRTIDEGGNVTTLTYNYVTVSGGE